MITLPNVRADQKFYREIGRHFVMAGFRQPPVNAEIMNTRTRPVPQEPVRWPPQKSVMMRKDTMLVSEYSVSERAVSSFLKSGDTKSGKSGKSGEIGGLGVAVSGCPHRIA